MEISFLEFGQELLHLEVGVFITLGLNLRFLLIIKFKRLVDLI